MKRLRTLITSVDTVGHRSRVSPREPGLPLPLKWRTRQSEDQGRRTISSGEVKSMGFRWREGEVREGYPLWAFSPLHQPCLRYEQAMRREQARHGRARQQMYPHPTGRCPRSRCGAPAKTLESSEPFWPLRRGGQRLLPASRGAEHLSSKSLFKVMWIFFLSPEVHSNIFP